ncbi:MAG: chromate transporter [Bradyrhizobiaceae bacterium]|nr:chromate transporter [Bradyrhizobiaceae bacterium]
MADSAARNSDADRVPELSELFAGFLAISLSGFGGVLPWARRMLVERRGWLNEREFAEALALCQFLPGPNIVNMSIIVGSRFRGVAGALAAFAGLVGVPLLIMMACGALYLRYGELETLRGALVGLAAGAAGLLVAMAVKMTMPLVRERRVSAILFALAAFAAVGLLRLPLYWAVLVLAPLSMLWCYWRPR